ncbi:Uncharacterised protein [Vibrio cholerae]|nr:Uncharacterised protein [Vibrio cholerae]
MSSSTEGEVSKYLITCGAMPWFSSKANVSRLLEHLGL